MSKQGYIDALGAISRYYGDATAKRSGAPLMNHIHEGCSILLSVLTQRNCVLNGHAVLPDSDYDILAAFCIHPIVQNDEPRTWFGDYVPNEDTLFLAESYKTVANAYLCRPETDHITDQDLLEEHFAQLLEQNGMERHEILSEDLMLMLWADKVQNRKDFELYHKGTHQRSSQLTRYFDNWLAWLMDELAGSALSQ